jgi:hypothetical protein
MRTAFSHYSITRHVHNGYHFTEFSHQEFSDSMTVSNPVWTVDQEVGRRKKTIYVTCPNADCLKINKLDRRKILENGRFKHPGCFVCIRCESSFWPYLIGWDPEYLKITKKTRKLRTPI